MSTVLRNRTQLGDIRTYAFAWLLFTIINCGIIRKLLECEARNIRQIWLKRL